MMTNSVRDVAKAINKERRRRKAGDAGAKQQEEKEKLKAAESTKCAATVFGLMRNRCARGM